MVKDAVIREYLSALSSSEPVPGGGGASALAGALGVSLSLMVISLTLGKKKYADAESELKARRTELLRLRESFYREADKDEKVFLPLAAAYRMPRETEKEKRARDRALERTLNAATKAPLAVMEKALKALKCTESVASSGSKLAVSDAGVAATYLETALVGASYNVEINLASMADSEAKEAFRKRTEELLREGKALAAKIRMIVLLRIKK